MLAIPLDKEKLASLAASVQAAHSVAADATATVATATVKRDAAKTAHDIAAAKLPEAVPLSAAQTELDSAVAVAKKSGTDRTAAIAAWIAYVTVPPTQTK